MTPREGPPGTLVTLVGGFDRGVAVYMPPGAAALEIVRYAGRRIVVRIPADATSGILLVTVGDEEESAGEFRVVARASAH